MSTNNITLPGGHARACRLGREVHDRCRPAQYPVPRRDRRITARPELFGPVIVVGAPLAYWEGVHGKYPMRYSGGLLEGSWLTAPTSDPGPASSMAPGSLYN